MKPEIDRVYAYDQGEYGLHQEYDKINTKTQTTEYRYLQDGQLKKSKENEIVRYAQTFEVGRIKRTLLMISLERDSDKVSTFFESCIDSLDDESMKAFKMSTRKPKALDFYYE